mmetsp:Transcript_147319/g.473320  ORF Transcript_147319/g.473320 Transcript_147319/m.473320 type:complete len:267 (+) Transcript_147319:1030-1830(+)
MRSRRPRWPPLWSSRARTSWTRLAWPGEPRMSQFPLRKRPSRGMRVTSSTLSCELRTCFIRQIRSQLGCSAAKRRSGAGPTSQSCAPRRSGGASAAACAKASGPSRRCAGARFLRPSSSGSGRQRRLRRCHFRWSSTRMVVLPPFRAPTISATSSCWMRSPWTGFRRTSCTCPTTPRGRLLHGCRWPSPRPSWASCARAGCPSRNSVAPWSGLGTPRKSREQWSRRRSAWPSRRRRSARSASRAPGACWSKMCWWTCTSRTATEAT